MDVAELSCRAVRAVDRQLVVERQRKGPIRGKYSTKAEAVAAGKARAKRDKPEHVIHKRDGSIGERNSYGRDPKSRPG